MTRGPDGKHSLRDICALLFGQYLYVYTMLVPLGFAEVAEALYNHLVYQQEPVPFVQTPLGEMPINFE